MVRAVELTMDATDAEKLAAFWRTAVGYVDEPPPAPFATRAEWVASFDVDDEDDLGGAWLIDPAGVAPRLCILGVPEPKTAKNRLHMDLRVSDGETSEQRWAQIQAEVERLAAAGGSVVTQFAGHHVVMADPEGNEFCVA